MSDVEEVGLDLEMSEGSFVASAKRATEALDGFDRSASRIKKTLMGIGPETTPKAFDPKSSWWGVREHAQRLEQQMTALKNPVSAIVPAQGKHGIGLSEISEELANLESASGGLLQGGKLSGVIDQLGSMGKLGGSGGPVGIILAIAGACAVLDLAIGALIVGGLAKLGFEFAKTAAEAAKFGQESRLAMTQLLHGNAAEAAREFDEVRYSAASLGLEVNATLSSFQGLLRSQFKPELAKDILKMGADLQSVGVHAEEVQGVVIAMSQIKSKGKLQGEELMQLQERGISGELIQNAIMARMGFKNVAQVQKAQQAGKISADVGIAAILDAVKKKTGETELGEAGKAFANSTMSGISNQMKGAWENTLIDAGTFMAPGLMEISKLVKDTFTELMASDEVGQLVVTLKMAWSDFVDWFKEAWPSIKEVIPSVFAAVNTGIGLIVDGFRWLHDNWDTVKVALEVGLAVVGIAFAVVGVIGGAVLLGLAVAAEAVLLPFEMIAAAIWAIVDVAEGVYNWIVNDADWEACGSSIIEGIINGIESVIPDWLRGLLGIDGAGVGVNVSGLASAAANDAGALPTVRSGAASMGPVQSSIVEGDKILNLQLTVPAPEGGSEADGQAYGSGVATGMSRKIMGFLGSAGENAA